MAEDQDYAAGLRPMIDAGAEVRRKPRLSFDLYPPKEPDHDPVLADLFKNGNDGHVSAREADKVPSPDFIAPPPGLGQAPNRVPSDMQYERPPNVLSENAARGIAASAVEPFGQAGRLATGGSEDVAGDLAGVGAAVAPIPGAGIGKALGKAAKAGVEGAEHAATGHIGDMIRAYHGSPHDFDRFDLSKIGTGEGAQAYGHGLYFAENEKTARMYRDQLTSSAKPGDAGWLVNGTHHTELPPNQRAAVEDYIKTRDPKHLDDAGIGNAIINAAPAGKMYQVGIRANPEHFLDWDKPLSEQHHVMQRLPAEFQDQMRGAEAPTGEAMMRRVARPSFPIRDNSQSPWKASNAKTYEEALEMVGGDKSRVNRMLTPDPQYATQALREAGIPGIKYLDQGSRTPKTLLEGRPIPQDHTAAQLAAEKLDIHGSPDAAMASLRRDATQGHPYIREDSQKAHDLLQSGAVKRHQPEGTRNFVVFDDKLIDILKKYGIASIGALPAMNAFHYQDKQ